MRHLYLTARTERLDGAHVIALTGEADALTAGIAESELDAAVGLEASAVIVDLRDVTFIDSTVLSILLDASKRVRAGGGRFAVACTDAHIRKVFRVTGIDGLIPLFPSPARAMSALRRAANGAALSPTAGATLAGGEA